MIKLLKNNVICQGHLKVKVIMLKEKKEKQQLRVTLEILEMIAVNLALFKSGNKDL